MLFKKPFPYYNPTLYERMKKMVEGMDPLMAQEYRDKLYTIPKVFDKDSVLHIEFPGLGYISRKDKVVLDKFREDHVIEYLRPCAFFYPYIAYLDPHYPIDKPLPKKYIIDVHDRVTVKLFNIETGNEFALFEMVYIDLKDIAMGIIHDDKNSILCIAKARYSTPRVMLYELESGKLLTDAGFDIGFGIYQGYRYDYDNELLALGKEGWTDYTIDLKNHSNIKRLQQKITIGEPIITPLVVIDKSVFLVWSKPGLMGLLVCEDWGVVDNYTVRYNGSK